MACTSPRVCKSVTRALPTTECLCANIALEWIHLREQGCLLDGGCTARAAHPEAALVQDSSVPEPKRRLQGRAGDVLVYLYVGGYLSSLARPASTIPAAASSRAAHPR